MTGSFPLKKAEPGELERHMYALRTTFEKECSKQNDASSCHKLAEFVQTVEKNYPEAAELFKQNCEGRKFGQSCLSYGFLNFIGAPGLSKDQELGFKYFQRGCDLGCPDACNNAGMSARRGQGTSMNMKVAAEYFERACDGDDPRGCFNLSTLYLQGGGEQGQNSVAQDLARAAKFAEKSCELGHVYGCVNAAIQYEQGDGVKQDLEKAEKLKQRAKELHREQSTGMKAT